MAQGKKRKGTGSKRSKAESMTGAKENKVEVRTAIGDNSKLGLPEPDDYAHHFKTIKGYMEKSATAASILRHAKQSANKVCPGLAADIAETIALEKENDPVKLKTRLELRGIGLRHIGSSIQLSVFDTLLGDTMEQAYQRGLSDAKAGRGRNNEFPENSDLADRYEAGFRHGTADNLGMTHEDADRAVAASDQEDEQQEAAQ